MKRFALLVVSLSCAAMADERAVWLQQTKLGDAELAKAHYPEAEEAFRAALKSVSPSDDVDPNASRLALLSRKLGRCHAGDDTADLLLLVLRADFGAAKPLLEARVKKAPVEGCWSPVVHHALALAYRAEGRNDEAMQLVEQASKLRCRALVTDPLESAFEALVVVPERRAVAEKTLGQGALMNAVLHPGKSVPAASCSDERGFHDATRFTDAGDRALATKRYVDAERWFRAALAVHVDEGDLSANSERLAQALLAQGTCETGDLTLDALIALHRGDVEGARVVAEASVHKLPTEPPHSTLLPSALVFSLWLEGKADEAREIEKSVAGLRGVRVRPDRLEVGLMNLNWAWMKPEQRSTSEKFAAKYLGANHPLLALYAAKRDGKKLPAPAACRARK